MNRPLNVKTLAEARALRCCGPEGCGDPGRYCIGDRCMAWCWAVSQPKVFQQFSVAADVSAETEPPRPADVPPSWEWIAHDPYGDDGAPSPAGWCEPLAEAYQRAGLGYCGLTRESP